MSVQCLFSLTPLPRRGILRRRFVADLRPEAYTCPFSAHISTFVWDTVGAFSDKNDSG